MSIFSVSHSDSMFEQFDPRVRLLWMFILSGVVIGFSNLLPVSMVAFTLLPVWLLASRTRFMIKSSLQMMPYLLFLGLIQLTVVWISTGELLTFEAFRRSLVEVLRFYVMISSAVMLFQTTSFGEFSASIRSFKNSRMPEFWNKGAEMFAFTLSSGYQLVPLLSREMEIIVQAQRAQGIGVTEGSRIEQVRKLVRMGAPLLVRSIELVKSSVLAVINYGYRPNQPRSQYRQLCFRSRDWLAIFLLLAGAASFFIIF